MTYVLNLIAFTTVIVGVLGNTHDDKTSGLRGVRPLGWFAVSLGFVALVVSGYTSYSQKRELDAARNEKAARQRDAREQIQKSLGGTFEGLNVIYREFVGGGNFSDLKDLRDPGFVKFLETFDTLQPVHDPQYIGSDGKPIIQLMETLTDKGLADFDLRVGTFQDLLSADIVKSAHELHDDRRYNLFRGADMALWADRATEQTHGKHLPHFVIDPDQDPETRKFNEDMYLELISEAMVLQESLGTIGVKR